jgi:hypothetical protein
MLTRKGWMLLAALGLLGPFAAAARAEEPTRDEVPDKSAERTIKDWPGTSRAAADALIAEYGQPFKVEDAELTWLNSGKWRKTVVYRESPHSFLGIHDRGIIEQTIAYDVPDAKLEELFNFEGGLRYSKTAGELSSRAETEKLNFLAVNLADDIVTDKLDSDGARFFYNKTVKLSKAGKSSPYMNGFLFPLGDRGRPIPDSREGANGGQNPSAEPAPTAPPYESGTPDRVTPPPHDLLTPSKTQ